MSQEDFSSAISIGVLAGDETVYRFRTGPLFVAFHYLRDLPGLGESKAFLFGRLKLARCDGIRTR